MKLLLSITIAATYGVLMRILFVSFGDYLGVMSLVFFFVIPFYIGYLTVIIPPYRETHTAAGAFFKPWLSCALILFITTLLQMEGDICWVMAYPLIAIISGIGGFIAFDRKKRRHMKKGPAWDFEKDKMEKPDTFNVSLLLFIPLLLGVLEGKRTTSLVRLSIEKQIDLPAPPDAVWKALTMSRQSTDSSQHLSLCNLMGFPRHISTTMNTFAVGMPRVAVYEKGLTFDETITRIDPNRRFDVSIVTDPSKISKAIMDEHIVIGGEHIQMEGDSYTLQPLPNGRTRLSLVSHFRINTPFNWYARLWADWLMSDVLREELQSLNANLMAAPTSGSTKKS